jgi:hypothetical protein
MSIEMYKLLKTLHPGGIKNSRDSGLEADAMTITNANLDFLTETSF